jgi:dienelactone hydrolase
MAMSSILRTIAAAPGTAATGQLVDNMDMGGKETQDVAAGADYLKTLGYVDPDHIGVYGLSHGGFMTLQAVTTTPTLFRCAIDVAGVGDWQPGTLAPTPPAVWERLHLTPRVTTHRLRSSI